MRVEILMHKIKERLITNLNMHLKIQTEFQKNVSVLELVVRHLNHAGNGFLFNNAIYLAP